MLSKFNYEKWKSLAYAYIHLSDAMSLQIQAQYKKLKLTQNMWFCGICPSLLSYTYNISFHFLYLYLYLSPFFRDIFHDTDAEAHVT